MDNTKIYKKIGTWFWWLLAVLPFVIYLILIIGSILNVAYNNGGAHLSASDFVNYVDLTINQNSLLEYAFGRFDFLSMDYFNIAFERLFDILGVSNNELLAIPFAWFVSVNVYHLVIDVIVWLPHKAHNLVE